MRRLLMRRLIQRELMRRLLMRMFFLSGALFCTQWYYVHARVVLQLQQFW